MTTEWIIGLTLLPAIIFLLVASSVVVVVRRLSDPQLEPLGMDAPRVPSGLADASVHRWAQSCNFQFLGYYYEHRTGSFIAAWQLTDQPTFFCVYILQDRRFYDFITLYDRNISLCTGSSKDGQTLPSPPGHFVQTFTHVTLDQQYTEHNYADTFIRGRLELILRADVTFETAFVNSLRRTAQHVRTLPFWFFRGLHWFFVRRRRLHGRTIEQLWRENRLPMPNESADEPEFAAATADVSRF